MNEDKKIGDWVILYNNEEFGLVLHKIQSLPEVFKSNKLATKAQVEAYKKAINYGN